MEDKLQHVLQHIRENPDISQCEAAATFKVPLHTLQRRAKGIPSRRKSHAKQAILTAGQANALVSYCHELAKLAIPLTRLSLRQKVFALVQRMPSHRWVRRFLSGRPNILAAHGRPLDPKRVKCFNRAAVYGFFDHLEKVVSDYNIQIQNVYNFDEKGIQLGGGCKGMQRQYLWHPLEKFKYVRKSDSLVLITVIEAASADGVAVPPAFILPPGEICDWSDVPGVGR